MTSARAPGLRFVPPYSECSDGTVEQHFRLANGTRITRKKGGALFRRGDRVGVADVIFGQEADSALLGATTLGALGLSLDPIRRELEPLPLILAAV